MSHFSSTLPVVNDTCDECGAYGLVRLVADATCEPGETFPVCHGCGDKHFPETARTAIVKYGLNRRLSVRNAVMA